MQSILEQITDWLKSMIISGIMGNLSGMFDSVNQQVGQIAGDVGTTPANFSPAVFSMIRNISESVILPIAGMVLTFIACYELIQMLIEHNNLANFETWTFFKWVFKTFLAVTLISNTFNITMAVFDVAQQVISRSGGLISGSTSVSDATLTAMQATLERHSRKIWTLRRLLCALVPHGSIGIISSSSWKKPLNRHFICAGTSR